MQRVPAGRFEMRAEKTPDRIRYYLQRWCNLDQMRRLQQIEVDESCRFSHGFQ